MTDLFNLRGQTAIITGGSIGLGSQMAYGLADAGVNLVIAARKVDRCEELCKKLEDKGISAIPAACDVSNIDDCQRLVDLAVSTFERIDILVNNAGYTWGADAMDYPMEKWHQVMNVNVTGTFQLSAMVARVMKEQGRGKIINVSSVAGFIGAPPERQNAIAYNASKGAVNVLTKDMAVKWARYGICVNAIAPGFFPTHMTEGVLKKNIDHLLPRIPLKRLGGETDLQGVVVFLSSSASDYITGQCLVVDGGCLAQGG